MKVENAHGILLSLSDEEVADLKVIAKRDGITLEEALCKSIQHYCSKVCKHLKRR